jgi:hypothetical protein
MLAKEIERWDNGNLETPINLSWGGEEGTSAFEMVLPPLHAS